MNISSFLIVVPAHNEAELIASALSALQKAMAGVPSAHCLALVVADTCSDRTADIVREFDDSRFQVIEGGFGSAGASRRNGVRHGLKILEAHGYSREHIWLANTDADSQVPPHWLSCQNNFARQGFDAVLGTVEPWLPSDSDKTHLSRIERWHGSHRLAENHTFIFGANLGVSVLLYDKTEGFSSVALGEDLALVKNLLQHGAKIKSTDQNRVKTSSRLRSKVHGGFASYLASL